MCTLTLNHYSAHSQDHFWNTCIWKASKNWVFTSFRHNYREIKFGRDLWKCPAQSPAQSRVTSAETRLLRALSLQILKPSKHGVGQLISSNYTLKQWTVFSFVQIQILHLQLLVPKLWPCWHSLAPGFLQPLLRQGKAALRPTLGLLQAKKLN